MFANESLTGNASTRSRNDGVCIGTIEQGKSNFNKVSVGEMRNGRMPRGMGAAVNVSEKGCVDESIESDKITGGNSKKGGVARGDGGL